MVIVNIGQQCTKRFFYLHFLLKKGQAHKNYSTDFYYYADERVQNKVVFGSPYKQWVYDRSITNAKVPVISGGAGALSAGESGMIVDYENGRVLFDSSVSSSAAISGAYSVKDFNTYVSNQDEESLIIEGK